MTLLPSERRDVTGVNDPDSVVQNHLCPVPGCFEHGTERHHLWRRSELIGDYSHVRWVECPRCPEPGATGIIVLKQNVVWMCHEHHRAITENEAWIQYLEGRFAWFTRARLDADPNQEAWKAHGWLDPQPGQAEKAELGPGMKCPRCHRAIPQRRPRLPARERKTMSIRVPKDAAENGMAVLDELIERAAELIPHRDADSPPYYVLVDALGWFVLNYTPAEDADA